MQTEQHEQFNMRLSRWIASQGFWFQLRHSMASSGTRGSVTYHLLRMAFRLFIFVLILALGGLYYLVQRTDQNAFRMGLRQTISESIGADQLAMRDVKRIQGNLEISRLASEGGPGTFFEFFEIRNLRCQMGLLDGLMGKWDPGTISIHRLDMQLRAGTDTPEDSSKIGEIIFREFENIHLQNIDIANANLTWGYSDRARGRIDNTSIKIRREDGNWRITLRGGEFHQNWLKGLQVAEIIAVCSPDGIVFEKTELRHGSGTLDFAGLRVLAGDRPEVRGTVKIRGLSLEPILPAAARNFVEGRFSSDFTVSGSTNSAEGISFDGVVVMDGSSVVSVRDQIHLLRALSVVDFHNNYRRLDFNEGSFRLTTSAGQMVVRDIKLAADDLATIAGAFKARPPSNEELDVMLARQGTSRGSGLSAYDDDADERFLLNVEELERQFTLRQAANAARRLQDSTMMEDEGQIFDRIGMNYEARMFAEQQATRLSRMLVYEGELAMTVRANAFDRTETLQKQFPPNPETGRIQFNVPLAGPLHELTLAEAEAIYEMGRR
ncbi:MAG: hypothetical protein ACNA8L_07020 [Luteolibacter sp.]